MLRLAKEERALRAVKAAQGAFAAGHKFWGNQWSSVAVHPAGDPAGEPSGKLVHAVIVAKGKRYRGLSHFQAMMEAVKSGDVDWSAEGLEHEGFETESGHFLDREQAGQYVKMGSRLFMESLPLAARDGKLYTQDRVMAAEPAAIPTSPGKTHHERAFDAAAAKTRKAVAKVVAQAEASALEARGQDEKEREKRRKRDEEAALLLLFLAGVAAYRAAHPVLVQGASAGRTGALPQPGQENAPTATQTPANAPLEAETEAELARQAEAHAGSRADLLKEVPGKVRERLDKAVEDGLAAGEDLPALVERLGKVGQQVEDGYGKVVAETEAQAAYGAVQSRLLERAGFATKFWVAVGDDRTCETCVDCERRGNIPLAEEFLPGVKEPPAHPMCRCWLEGGSRKPKRATVGASEPVGHEFHGNQYKQVGVGYIPSKHKLSKPVMGPTGAQIVGYEWRSTMGIKWNPYKQEEVEARISDWDNSEKSTGTGRDIVHVFHVQHKDGVVRPEGIQSAQNVLGITSSRLMTIAKKERAIQEYRQQQRQAEAQLMEQYAAPTPQEAAQAFRKNNYSAFRSEDDNNAFFYNSELWEKSGKYLRKPALRSDDMIEFGWTKVTPDPAKQHVSPEYLAKMKLLVKSVGASEPVQAVHVKTYQRVDPRTGKQETVAEHEDKREKFTGKVGGIGLKRVGEGKEAKWVTHEGKEMPEHAKAHAIPPAWQNVRVAPTAEHDLQVVGHDAKGREQRVYSKAFTEKQAALKFSRNKELMEKRDAVFKQNDKNLKSGDRQTVENAACMKLIQQTGIRPGSDSDTGAEKQAYGATTLEGRHVVVEGGQVRLKFVGKKGVDLDISVEDKATADMLVERKRTAGDNGKLFKTDDGKLRDYSHTLDGGGFKPKDFRTLKGTLIAKEAIAKDSKPAATVKEFKKRVMAIAKIVAEKLGNTPTVALQSYINPFVFEAIKP